MPSKKTGKIWQEWIKKADDDELNIISILKHRDGTPGIICFLSQQMAEKYLKTLLIFFDQDYSKIHDLKKIATILESFIPDIFDLDDEFSELNKLYVVSRYPGEIPELSWKEAENSYAAAAKIKEFALKIIFKK